MISSIAVVILTFLHYFLLTSHNTGLPQEVSKKNSKFENSQPFVSSVKALQNSTSNQLSDFDRENKTYALKPKVYVDIEKLKKETLQTIETNLFQVSKEYVGR